MALLASLIFSLCALSISGNPTQTQNSNLLGQSFFIPRITADGRPDCGVSDLLTREIAGVTEKCSMAFPEGKSSFFDTSEALLCFGMYDTLYQMCNNTKNLSYLKIPVYEPSVFCRNASKSFDSYDSHHRDPNVLKWALALKSSMKDVVNCSELCLFQEKEVRKECSVIVAALDEYTTSMAAVKQTKEAKPNPVTPSMEAKSSSRPAPSEPDNPKPEETKIEPQVPDPAGPAELKTEVVSESSPVAKPEVEPVIQETQPEPVDVPKSGFEDEGEEDPDGVPPMVDSPGPGPLPNVVPAVKGPSTEEGKPFMEDDKEMGDKTPFLTDDRPGVAMFHKNNNDEESNLVTYFILMTGGGLLLYVAFHNKNKLLALALEGRRTSRRGGRHSSASYSKLHSNLEEAIASGPTSPSATHVLY